MSGKVHYYQIPTDSRSGQRTSCYLPNGNTFDLSQIAWSPVGNAKSTRRTKKHERTVVDDESQRREYEQIDLQPIYPSGAQKPPPNKNKPKAPVNRTGPLPDTDDNEEDSSEDLGESDSDESDDSDISTEDEDDSEEESDSEETSDDSPTSEDDDDSEDDSSFTDSEETTDDDSHESDETTDSDDSEASSESPTEGDTTDNDSDVTDSDSETSTDDEDDEDDDDEAARNAGNIPPQTANQGNQFRGGNQKLSGGVGPRALGNQVGLSSASGLVSNLVKAFFPSKTEGLMGLSAESSVTPTEVTDARLSLYSQTHAEVSSVFSGLLQRSHDLRKTNLLQ